ncbi:MAG: hypothetical protein EXQ59_05515 [Acidobacteria bacterium]|nr:hypothetical protein [Acidobacteriota bacterium]
MGAEGRRIYLDTSAYLCLLLSEAGSDALVKQTAGAALLSSVLLVLEARRNVIRLGRTGIMSADDCQVCLERIEHDMADFALRDLTLDLCESKVMPSVSTPRSLGLAHIRTALWFHAELPIERFLTVDQAQTAAAREMGLPV